MIFGPGSDSAGVQPARLRVLGYHEFCRTGSEDVYQITPEILRGHLAAGVGAAERSGAELIITFDDAHRSQVELAAPVLESFGLRGIFFAPGAWVGTLRETATWAELRGLLASGHRIGSHGQNHVLLTQCSETKLCEELVQSRQTLEDHLGQTVQAISMPGGRWNTRVVAACHQAGYREFYTSTPEASRTKAFASSANVPLIIGRLVVRRTMPLSKVAGYVAEDWLTLAGFSLEYKAKQILKRVLGDADYQAIWRLVMRSPVQGVTDPTSLQWKD